MSGQRNKRPDDIIKKRQEYLDNLNLEISLQDGNEQAVRQYKETGQMPPVTQMKDNRTVEQKLRDYEKLKQSIREDLAPIATPELANLIIQIVQNSPFNKDNNLLVFLAQRAPDIVKNLEKIYKFGIKGDYNDAEQFAQFVIKMYSDKNSMVENTKSIMARLGTNTQSGLAKKATEQSYVLSSLEAEMNTIINSVLSKVTELNFNRILKNKQRNITQYINIARELYPPSLSYKIPRTNLTISLMNLEAFFNEKMTSQFGLPTPTQDDFKLFLQYLNHNLPNTDYYNTLLTQLKRAGEILMKLENPINKENFLNAIDNIKEYIFNTGETIAEITEIRNALYRILNLPDIRSYSIDTTTGQPAVAQPAVAQPAVAQPEVAPTAEREGEPAEGFVNEQLRQPEEDLNRIPADYDDFDDMEYIPRTRDMYGRILGSVTYPIRYLDEAIRGRNRRDQEENPQELEERRRYYDRKTFIERIARQRLNEEQMRFFYTTVRRIDNEVNTGRLNYGDASEELKGFSEFYLHLDPSRSGHGIKGSGLNSKLLKTVPIDKSLGVQEDPRYIKFGRYLVNTKKLKDDILSLRREKGTPIASLPAYKMTRPFKNVVNKIIGGALPGKEDFDKLTDDEKRYLHKVSKEADLSHKLEIPSPSKDEDEREEHLFNVYKGEIMAGNDNKDMVKKFKLLLMKLSRKNYINKNEANDILEMLTNAGY